MYLKISKAFSWVLLSFMAGRCTCGSPVPKPVPVPTAVIHYTDHTGKDLLDPSNAGIINLSQLAILWKNPDGTWGNGAIQAYRMGSNSSSPYLPAGYVINVPPYLFGSSGIKYIRLSNADTDTLSFIFSGSTLKSFLYNGKLVPPPNGMGSYPALFPVLVTK
ncbi:MAG: hypothetical protein JST69_04940 [Bacteroidetes bacterium]|nr:hypothetical protein [Bacteroidota bacterium]